MIKKVYGKHIANIKWVKMGNGALVNRCLEIYKTKTQYKGYLWDCGKKGWREEPNHPITVLCSTTLRMLYEKCCLLQCIEGEKLEVQFPVPHDYGTLKEDKNTFLDESEALTEVFCMEKYIYLVYLESMVDGEAFFTAVPCKTLKKAKEVLREERDAILKEGHHWKVWSSIEEMEEEGIEVTDEEEYFYINDPSDNYYEDYKIEYKRIEE